MTSSRMQPGAFTALSSAKRTRKYLIAVIEHQHIDSTQAVGDSISSFIAYVLTQDAGFMVRKLSSIPLTVNLRVSSLVIH
jgi:hypothetical protein